MTISYSAIAKFSKDKEQDQQDQVSLRNKLQHNIYLVTEQNSFKVIFKYVNRVVLLAHLLKELWEKLRKNVTLQKKQTKQTLIRVNIDRNKN